MLLIGVWCELFTRNLYLRSDRHRPPLTSSPRPTHLPIIAPPSPPTTPSPYPYHSKPKEIAQTLRFEYERSRSVSRTFTERGFDKGLLAKLDPELWASIATFVGGCLF